MNIPALSRTTRRLLASTSSAATCSYCQSLQALQRGSAPRQRARNFVTAASSSAQTGRRQDFSEAVRQQARRYISSNPSLAQDEPARPSSGPSSLSPETLAAIKAAAAEHAPRSPTSIAESHLKDIRYRTEAELYDITNKKKRATLNNMDTARAMVAAMEGLKDKQEVTVIDLYAGEGYLTQALLELPNVKQVIAVEHVPSCIPKIDKLVEQNPLRLHHIALDPFWWDTYGVIEQRGLMQGIQKEPWDQEHSGLVLTGILPDGLFGERLLIQFLNCIPGEMWLYDYGRIASHFLVSSTFGAKLQAKPGMKTRHKLAVLLESHSTVTTELSTTAFEPYKSHFKTNTKSKANPSLTFNKFVPLKDRVIETGEELEVLEFLTRNLFIHKVKPWSEALKYLAPGCEIIAKNMRADGHPVDLKKKAPDLTIQEWRWMIEAFMKWPFRPTDLEQNDVDNAKDLGKDAKRI